MDVERHAVRVQDLVLLGGLGNLERPDRAALGASSAMHDRLERHGESTAPGSHVFVNLP